MAPPPPRPAHVAALAFAVAACNPTPAPNGAPAPPVPSAAPPAPAAPSATFSASSAPVAPPADPSALLLPFVVTGQQPARATLFTWTTRDQAEELAKRRVLLTRTESPANGASYFDQILAERAKDPRNKLAALLRSSAYAKARFAWPSPWPTRLGWPGEAYGDVLVGMVLKPEALVVHVRATAPAFAVFDMTGAPVAPDVALKTPARIAAVYFVQDNVAPFQGGSFAAPIGAPRQGYREYVVCNEAMIAEWSIGTARERDALTQSIAALEAFAPFAGRRLAGTSQPAWNAEVVQRWPRPPEPKADAFALYAASLAIPSDHYVPVEPNLHALAAALAQAADLGEPIVHRPTTPFPTAKIAQPQSPPRVVPPPPRRGGTY